MPLRGEAGLRGKFGGGFACGEAPDDAWKLELERKKTEARKRGVGVVMGAVQVCQSD